MTSVSGKEKLYTYLISVIIQIVYWEISNLLLLQAKIPALLITPKISIYAGSIMLFIISYCICLRLVKKFRRLSVVAISEETLWGNSHRVLSYLAFGLTLCFLGYESV
jgi:hypothetical protein